MPRAVGTTTASAPAPDVSTTDLYYLSAQAGTATFGVPTGGPVDGQKLLIRVYDNGVARTLAWNAIYVVITGVTLPVLTTVGKYTYIGCIYNSAATAWQVVAVGVSS